jgi:hypothetical protein
MKKIHHTFLKALPFLLLFTAAAQGQWLTLHTFASKPYCIHFLDREQAPKVGFVGLHGEIWRTADRGKTWNQISTPASLVGNVLSFSFKDSLIGWCSADQQFSQTSNGPGCFKTTDGGLTWAPLPPIGNRPCVYYNPSSHALILTAWDRNQTGGINSAVSNDDGQTWVDIPNAGWMNGVAFVSNNVGIMTTYRFDDNTSGNYFISTNGGFSWNPVNEQREAWQPLSVPSRAVYFASAEGLRHYLRSNDNGNTWDTVCIFDSIISIDSYLTGDTRGDWDALYVQSFTANVPNATTNILGSVTQGKTWINLCGPANSSDTRMYWVSDTLWALDMNDYTLYYNPYGLKNTDKLLQFSTPQIDLYSNGCLDIDSMLRMLNFSTCPTFNVVLTKVEVSGNKSVFVVKSPILPHQVNPADSFKITFKPAKPTTDSTTLVIDYTIGGLSFEKRIKLRGFIIPGFQAFLKNLTAVLSADCNPIDTFVTVSAGACTGLQLDSVALTNTNPFSLGTINTPQSISANGTLKIPIHIAIAPVGTYTTKVVVKLTGGSITKDTSIDLTVTIVSNTQLVTNLTPAAVAFDTTSTCAVKFDTVFVKNTLCKKLYIASADIQPVSTDYTIVSPAMPDSVDAGAVKKFVVRFAPTSIGSKNIQLHFGISLDKTTIKDTFVTINGSGYTPIDVASAGGNTIVFTPIQYCDSGAKNITLTNLSCDSLTVIQVIPPGASDFIAPAGLTGKGMKPNDSLNFTILELPSSAGAKADSILVKVRTVSGAEQWIVLYLNGTVLPKHRLMSFTDLIHLDSLPPCTNYDTTLVIKNLGVCDTLILTSVTDSGYSLLSATSADIGKHIAPGGSFTVSIHIAASNTMQGKGSIHLFGNGFDTIITISTTSRVGGIPFTLNVSDSLFSTTSCSSVTREFTFKNASCNPIVIDAASISGSTQFTFVPAVKLPITIQPGDSAKIFIQFDPTAFGDSLATFLYHSATYAGQVKLRGTATGSRQFAHLTLALSSGSLPVQRVGSTVGIDLIWQDPLAAGVGLTSVEATMNYGDNTLTPKLPDIVAASGWTISCATPSTGRLDLCLSKTNGSAITAGSILATIPFFATISDVDRTTITLPNASFNNGDSLFAVCVLSPLASASIDFKIDSECAIPTLKHFLGTGKIFDKIMVIPNPSSRGEKEVLVTLSLNQASAVELSLTDILGRIVYEQRSDEQQTGLKEYHIPIQEAASGTYIIRLSASGETASIPLAIKR